MTAADSITSLMEQLRAGEAAAAWEVFQRFAHRLIGLARQQFSRRLVHRVDPEDVVQSAFKSFFIRHREGKLQVGNWNSLWGLLTVITLRKCADRAAYHRAECRDVSREAAAPPGPEAQPPWLEAPGREPTPVEAAALSETVEELLPTNQGCFTYQALAASAVQRGGAAGSF